MAKLGWSNENGYPGHQLGGGGGENEKLPLQLHDCASGMTAATNHCCIHVS